MTCPYCNQEHPDYARFCPETGERIEHLKKCPNCNEIVSNDAIFCPNCRERIGFSDLIVDLGLKIKWANCNFGAEELGTPEDTSCLCSRYSNSGISEEWGTHWRMPTVKDFEELIEKCTIYAASLHGIKGIEVEGPNGKTIFMPATFDANRSENYKWMGVYFSCSNVENDSEKVYAFLFAPTVAEIGIYEISWSAKAMIRPIYEE